MALEVGRTVAGALSAGEMLSQISPKAMLYKIPRYFQNFSDVYLYHNHMLKVSEHVFFPYSNMSSYIKIFYQLNPFNFQL